VDQSTADGVCLAFSRLRTEEWVDGLQRVASAAAATRSVSHASGRQGR
jgi:hypothetical protein